MNQYTRITGNATTTIRSVGGVLDAIILGDGTTGGVITVYDSTTGSGTVIIRLQVGTPSGGLLSTSGLPNPTLIGPLNVPFINGLTVVTSGSTSNDITILYR